MKWWLKATRRRRLDRDLDEEIAFHRAMPAADFGAPRFGNETHVKETAREMWSFALLETTLHDLRCALRRMARNPAFATTAVLSLAIGIGAVFTVADNLLLRPLPYRDPSQLVMVWEARKTAAASRTNSVSPANYFDRRAQNDVFASMAAFTDRNAIFSDGRRVEELRVQYVSADLLPMLGVQPLRGRLFQAGQTTGRTGTVGSFSATASGRAGSPEPRTSSAAGSRSTARW